MHPEMAERLEARRFAAHDSGSCPDSRLLGRLRGVWIDDDPVLRRASHGAAGPVACANLRCDPVGDGEELGRWTEELRDHGNAIGSSP